MIWLPIDFVALPSAIIPPRTHFRGSSKGSPACLKLVPPAEDFIALFVTSAAPDVFSLLYDNS
jgi:hypothetical protein